jgi:hypothetical protein
MISLKLRLRTGRVRVPDLSGWVVFVDPLDVRSLLVQTLAVTLRTLSWLVTAIKLYQSMNMDKFMVVFNQLKEQNECPQERQSDFSIKILYLKLVVKYESELHPLKTSFPF